MPVRNVGASNHPATQCVAPKLFLKTKTREGRRMLIIAAGLTIALVAADLLDLTSRKDASRTRLG